MKRDEIKKPMNPCVERLTNGLFKENPTLVLMLGMCPTLAVTTSATNGLGMGLSTTVVLVMSNLLISMLRKIIPDKVRIPTFIVIVASFVTVVQLLIEGYLPDLNESLGIYIPLIVVNCIILGRAEAYASKNPVLPSIFDGLGMGLGFSLALTLLGALRELLGAGTFFGQAIPFLKNYEPFTIFIMAPGAFFTLTVLTAIQNKLRLRSATNGTAKKQDSMVCGGDCASCIGSICMENRRSIARGKEEEARVAAEKKLQAKVGANEAGASDAKRALTTGAAAHSGKADASGGEEAVIKADSQAKSDKTGAQIEDQRKER